MVLVWTKRACVNLNMNVRAERDHGEIFFRVLVFLAFLPNTRSSEGPGFGTASSRLQVWDIIKSSSHHRLPCLAKSCRHDFHSDDYVLSLIFIIAQGHDDPPCRQEAAEEVQRKCRGF